MATVYRAPIEPPAFNHATWREDEARYLDELRAKAKADAVRLGSKRTDLVGEIVKFQVADGYALYMVWRQSPLALVHIDTMDGYRIPEAHMRGLRLADIKAMVEQERRWRRLIDEQKAEKGK